MPDELITDEDRLDAVAYRRLRDRIVAAMPEEWGDDVAEEALVESWVARWGGVYTDIALVHGELEEPVGVTALVAASAEVAGSWSRPAELRAALVRLAAVAVAGIEAIDRRSAGREVSR